MSAAEEFQRLVHIMHRLRRECPWDREQDHASLRGFLLEETYELLDALDDESPPDLCEELGDLLLQIVFHAEIAEEAGEFDIEDVLRGITDKLVRRHPHVFADEDAPTGADVHRRWEHIKKHEENKESVLSGVPRHLPALLKAVRVLGKIRRSGLDPFVGRDAAEEAERWLGRLREAVARGDGRSAERASGMLCLAVASLADKAGASPEDGLRERLSRLADAFCVEEGRLAERRIGAYELPREERDRTGRRLLSHCEED